MITHPQLGQSTYLDELPKQLDKLDRRLMKDRALGGIRVWVDMLRSVVADAIQESRDQKAAAKARDERIYQELMLLETDLAGAKNKEQGAMLERVGRLKGLLACSIVAFSLYWAINYDADLRKTPRRVRAREELVA